MRSDISTQVLFKLEGFFNRFLVFLQFVVVFSTYVGVWGRELRGF